MRAGAGAAVVLGVLLAVAGPAVAQNPASPSSPSPSPSPAEGSSGAIHGVVTDQTTDSAVAGAHVLVAGTPLVAATDPTGQFRVAGLDPDTYTIRVLAIGYVAATAEVTVAAGATAEVAVSLERAPLQLPGIDVTASGGARSVAEAPVSIVVMERLDLEKFSPVQLPDVLPFVPGVAMNHGQVDVRGASGLAGGLGSRVLVLLDGHPALTGDGGEIDFEDLPLLDLDRAEVVKGSQSALYGSAALGGVINLISSPIDPEPATSLRLHFGSYDTPKPFRWTSAPQAFAGLDVQHSRAVGAVGVRLALGREGSDGYEQNGEFSRWLGRLKLSSLDGAAHPWDAYVVWSMLRSGQFAAWRSDSQPYQVPDSAVGDWNRVSNILAGGRYTAIAGSRALLTIEPSATFTTVKDHMHDSRNWHEALRTGVNARLALNPGSAHAVTAGVEVAGTSVNSSYYGQKYITDAAPYAQEEFALGPALKLTAGARLDLHHVDGGTAEQAFNPKLAAAFTPPGAFTLRASFGRGYRAPSAIEQFVKTFQQGFQVEPNPSLKGETAWSGEVGGTASLGLLWLDAALFSSWYHGLIGPAAVPGQFGAFSFQNVQRARVRGLDASSKVGVVPRLVNLDLSYTLLDARDLDTGFWLPYRSRHNVTGSLDLLGGAAGVDVLYRSRLEQVLAYPVDPRGDITVLDARLAFRLAGAVLQVKVGNLFQAKYVDVMERNQGAPRSLLVTGLASF